MPDPPTSSGRALLSRLLWEYCCVHWGLSPEEVASALSVGGERRGREGPRREVDMAVRLIGGVLADGGVRAFARSLGGGEPVEMRATLWEIDDFRPRFAASALDLKRPFDSGATPTHWIFVDAADGERLIEASCADVRAPVRPPRPTAPGDAVIATAIPMVHTGERLLRRPEVEKRTGLPRSSIYARMKAERFPRQVPTGGSVAFWRESDVDSWIANPT